MRIGKADSRAHKKQSTRNNIFLLAVITNASDETQAVGLMQTIQINKGYNI